jgi:ketosteroid isomerase-like protein
MPTTYPRGDTTHVDHIETVKAAFTAFATADRDRIERLLAEDLTFSAPPDVGIDRATYFERCWPGAGSIRRFDYVRLVEVGEEVLVTYEATREDGTRLRNTEIYGFRGERIVAIEVYFGWDLD